MKLHRFWARMALTAAIAVGAAGCGDSDGSVFGPGGPGADGDTIPPIGDTAEPGAAGSGETDGVDVCQLLTPDEIMTAMGFAEEPLPSFEHTRPAGPFTGCSWGTGWLLVQVAEADRLIVPPGDPCDVIDLGEDARECPGSIKFLIDGVHVSVTTLDPHPNSSLLAIAALLLPVVEAL